VAFGPSKRGLDAALMLTGRWGFLLFWPAYAGTGISAALGGRFDFLKIYGREFGLAFAAAMQVHVGLIAWLCVIGAAPAAGIFVFFGAALLCIYTLAVFSVTGWQRKLGTTWFWLLRALAMNDIAYAFAVDFLSDPASGGLRHIVLYAPFALLSLVGFAAYAFAQLVSLRRALSAA
jgi:hypothetical protein